MWLGLHLKVIRAYTLVDSVREEEEEGEEGCPFFYDSQFTGDRIVCWWEERSEDPPCLRKLLGIVSGEDPFGHRRLDAADWAPDNWALCRLDAGHLGAVRIG